MGVEVGGELSTRVSDASLKQCVCVCVCVCMKSVERRDNRVTESQSDCGLSGAAFVDVVQHAEVVRRPFPAT